MAREAARFFHYTLGQWEVEHPMIQARAIAHYCEHNVREAYRFEKQKAAQPDKDGATNTPVEAVPEWARFRQGGGR